MNYLKPQKTFKCHSSTRKPTATTNDADHTKPTQTTPAIKKTPNAAPFSAAIFE
jgi:hypothetical protein